MSSEETTSFSEEPASEQSYFRDSLTTVSKEGKRVWVYPKKPRGKLYRYRSVVAMLLLAFLFAAPFIQYKGDPLILLNVIDRQFIIFGLIFWPQDFYLVVLSMIALVVFIILFTVIYGRIFCGWVCPQTIFMEFLFRQIDYIIEGDYHKQKKLDRQNWNFEKIWKKSVKQFIFFGVAFLIANIFLAYLVGVDRLKLLVTEGPVEHSASFIALVLFSGVFYFIFAFFREQVCIIACPYGRLQGVLLDNQSIVVTYDYMRGEPKGKYNPLEDRSQTTKGDCIDCYSCVTVCPTSIDIRNGTQLECINCTACIDACNAIMQRVNLPKGLIRYDSEEGIASGKRSILTPRSIAYSFALIILLSVFAVLMSLRTDFEASIFRQPGTLFQEYGKDNYSNIYQIDVVNKTRKTHLIELKLIDPAGEIIRMGDPLLITKGQSASGNFLVVIPRDNLASSNTRVTIGIFSGDELIKKYKVTFIGPQTIDKTK
ncbi:MAG: cytochrome c oxidase accessory protein CcoG [Bacteroidales bacterium]